MGAIVDLLIGGVVIIGGLYAFKYIKANMNFSQAAPDSGTTSTTVDCSPSCVNNGNQICCSATDSNGITHTGCASDQSAAASRTCYLASQGGGGSGGGGDCKKAKGGWKYTTTGRSGKKYSATASNCTQAKSQAAAIAAKNNDASGQSGAIQGDYKASNPSQCDLNTHYFDAKSGKCKAVTSTVPLGSPSGNKKPSNRQGSSVHPGATPGDSAQYDLCHGMNMVSCGSGCSASDKECAKGGAAYSLAEVAQMLQASQATAYAAQSYLAEDPEGVNEFFDDDEVVPLFPQDQPELYDTYSDAVYEVDSDYYDYARSFSAWDELTNSMPFIYRHPTRRHDDLKIANYHR